jgi:mono/diheme cytochrome c family protein
MQFWILTALAAGLATSVSAAPGKAKPAAPVAAAVVDFARDIRPIISANCFACHGPDEGSRMAGVRLDVREEAVKDRGVRSITPGKPEASRVYLRIAEKDPARRMPPPSSGHSLTPGQIQLIKRWIAQGAPYAGHWAFQMPKRPALPTVKHTAWVRSPVDAFILARLEKAGLRPSPEADRYTLIRRLSLDLIGLPPTPEEVNAFVQDQSPGAYEKLVDRLLASPHYGERWARMWLDLARYADSAGYGSDPLRLNIWPYRDWVINAFNRNLPYDQFTVDQIAGDLLPNPTKEQLIATAFHRNTMTNTEGGTDDEEFRVAAVKDRIATTAQVWTGLTMGCAQCHSHKFDPITHREYYQFFALFNQTEDNDQPDETPTMPMPTAEQQEKMDRLKGEIAALETRIAAPSPTFQAELAEWERSQSRPLAWAPLEVEEIRSTSGATLTKLPDGSVLAGGKAADTDTYTLRARTPLKGITALRLELLPDESLPEKGPGRAPGTREAGGGNLVLSDLKVAVAPGQAKPVMARYVRVENTGAARLLSLAEVEVVSGGANVAPKGTASQSSTDYEGAAQRAIDRNTNGHYFEANSTTHTRTEDDPWWEVDLGAEVPIEAITVWNRTDNGLGTRLTNFRVAALAADRKPVWETKVGEPPSPSKRLSPHEGRTVMLRNASSSFDQAGFEVEKAIDGDRKSGWAIAGGTGRAQAAVFETAAPLGDDGGATLSVELVQSHGGGHTLGRFRLLATTAAPPVRELPQRIRELLAVAPEQRAEPQREELAAYFRPLAPSLMPLYQEAEQKRKELAALKPLDVPIMREVAAEKRRVTHIMNKGNFLDPGEVVQAALPAAFSPLPAGAPKNRLGVARWLVSPENPLTARVAVNRFWAQLFGTGIVETEEDFGTQGALPTHPALLDWLAVEFRDPGTRAAGGWDMKALLKTIVTSATYRQSSKVTPAVLEKDPRNRLLARYPRRRLDAEFVRDQALALSGLLSRKIGGPSVYPPQPDGLWQAAFNGERTWPTSQGADRYRRGLYTFWRRTVPYPSMATFDAPSREICTVRRLPTNTPLQALVTLNDPAYVEMSQALARRIIRQGGAIPAQRARYALRLVLARPPQEAQVQALVSLYEKEAAHYRADPEAAKKLATEPLGSLPEGMDAVEAAAWTVVANVLLNLDGVLARG